MMTPAENGRELEVIIHNKSLNIPGLKHSLRENDIRSHFQNSSLHGVDHWIYVGKYNVLIQDIMSKFKKLLFFLGNGHFKGKCSWKLYPTSSS